MKPNTYPIYQAMKYYNWNIKIEGGNRMLYGIDISNWNSPSDGIMKWAEFCICKATEGRTFDDPKLYEHLERYEKLQGKRLSELCFGTYHFARPDSGNSAKEEADHYISMVYKYTGLGIMVLDVEGNATQTKYIDWVNDWMDYVHNYTGVKPLLYTSASFVSQYKYLQDADYGLWVANYKNYGNTFPEVLPNSIKPWPTLALWQWQNGKQLPRTNPSDSLTFYKESIDQNVFNGDAVAWQKYARGGTIPELNCTHCPIHCPGDE